ATGEIVGDDDTDESPENGEAPATGESDGPGAGGGTVPSTPESRGADRPASGSEGEQDSPADGSAQGDSPSAEPVEGEPAGSGEAEPGAEGPGGPLAAGLPQDEPAPQETAPAPPALGLPQDGPRSHGDALPLVHPAPSAPQPGDARTARVPGEGDAAPIQGVAPQPAQGEAAPGEGVAAGPGGNSPGPHRAAGSPDGGAAGQTGDPEVSGPAEQERPGDRTAPDGGPDQAPPQTARKNRGQQT
ncbi:MAG: excinuclease ABC subunit UvrC, partial [Streptomyces albidoflavus]